MYSLLFDSNPNIELTDFYFYIFFNEFFLTGNGKSKFKNYFPIDLWKLYKKAIKGEYDID